jgi:hypothetical protein
MTGGVMDYWMIGLLIREDVGALAGWRAHPINPMIQQSINPVCDYDRVA